jgi:tocopherol cyclase
VRTAWARSRSAVVGRLHPEGFHGIGVTKSFFEGWYVKLVSADLSERWAIIPGLFLGQAGGDEAFVQVLDGATGRSWYLPYAVSEFSAAEGRFDVRVGPNHFTAEGVHLELPEGLPCGDLRFTTALDPWPTRLTSPGIMGWYAWVPFMECYHGVCSFGHDLAGDLSIEGRTVHFDGGRGYLEKDWGRAFPGGYVWLHTNHVKDAPGVSLIASVALIPWLRGEFRGFIVGLRTPQGLRRWATYTGAREELLEVDDTHVRWTLTGRDGRLSLVAERRAGALLHAPIRTEMHRRVEETLDAIVHIRLEDPDGTVVLDSVGEAAGLEVHGDLDRLFAAGAR